MSGIETEAAGEVAGAAAVGESVVADEAAVAEVLGIFEVSVVDERTADSGTPSSDATTCATLMNNPCPISVPP